MIDDANGEAKNAAALPTSSAKEQDASYFNLDSLIILCYFVHLTKIANLQLHMN